MRVLVSLGFCVVIFALAFPSSAAALDEKAQARQHFDRGRNRYDVGDFAEALKEFKAAFQVKEDPAFLFNIGQCYSKLGDDTAAIHAYKSYLRREPDAPNRAQVESRIAELEDRQKKAGVTSPPPVDPVPPRPTVPIATPAPSTDSAVPLSAGLDVTSTSAPVEPTGAPVLKSWWFWTGVGAVVVGGVTTAILLSRGGTKDRCAGESLMCVRL